MPRQSSKRKKRYHINAKVRSSRVTRRTQKNLRKVDVIHPDVREVWDKTKTLKENFAALGLTLDPNVEFKDRRLAQALPSVGQYTEEELEQMKQSGQLQTFHNALVPTEVIDQSEAALPSSAISENGIKLLQKLEERAKQDAPVNIHASEGVKQFVTALIDKYGTDYKAMSRDRRLNYLQHTPNQIRRKCIAYLRSTGQLTPEIEAAGADDD